jgi:hypothetical protein
VRVPLDAAPGKVIVRFELPKNSEYAATATNLEIELLTKDK